MEEISNRILIKKYPLFRGGYEFRYFTERNLVTEIINVDVPKKIILRLRQGFGNEVPLIVNKGDKVRPGQIIARNDDIVSTPIISSVSGTILEQVTITYGNKTVNAVEIEVSDENKIVSIPRPDKNPLIFSSEEISEILYLSGVSALGAHGIPTHFHSSVIGIYEVKEVIVNALNTTPYSFPAEFIFDKYPERFTDSLRILKRLYPQARLNITIDVKKKDKLLKVLKKEKFNEEITIHLLSAKYPQEQEAVLLKTLFNKKLEVGKSAINLGVVIFSADEMLPIYEAVFEGKPLIERLIFVAGSGSFKEGFFLIRVGTPANYFLKEEKELALRIFSGGVLTGRLLDEIDGPTNKSTSSLTVMIEGATRDFLAFLEPGLKKDSYTNTLLSSFIPGFTKKITTNIGGEERPCVLCNYCDEVCPVRILPHLLYKLVKKDQLEEAVRYNLTACIKCDLCTYVCPSKLNLASTIYTNLLKVL